MGVNKECRTAQCGDPAAEDPPPAYVGDKKQRNEAANAETERELAALKEKLAALEAQQAASAPAPAVEETPVDASADAADAKEEEAQ